MTNPWVIEAQKFCGLSITHRWHRLLIDVVDYSSMTHRLLIVYYSAHERHFSCFLVPFFFVSDSFICVRRIFPCILRSWRPCFTGMRKRAASATTNRRAKFSHLQKMALRPCTKTASIHRTELLKNLQNGTTLTGQPSRCGSTTNCKEILENLLNLNFHVLLKLKRINMETSICLHLSFFNFVFLRQTRLQPRDVIDE